MILISILTSAFLLIRGKLVRKLSNNINSGKKNVGQIKSGKRNYHVNVTFYHDITPTLRNIVTN